MITKNSITELMNFKAPFVQMYAKILGCKRNFLVLWPENEAEANRSLAFSLGKLKVKFKAAPLLS